MKKHNLDICVWKFKIQIKIQHENLLTYSTFFFDIYNGLVNLPAMYH